MAMLRQIVEKQSIDLPNEYIVYKQIFKKKWVVYAKRPFGSPKSVLEYLGRYSHKIAISNHRILEVKDGKVSFAYKDYRQNGEKKVMQLSETEFIRRFALHILPSGFMRIRHQALKITFNIGCTFGIAIPCAALFILWRFYFLTFVNDF